MSDNPHDPQHRDEASFMLAAESAITQLQLQADEAKTAAVESQNAAGRSEASAKRWKILSVVLGFFVALLIATASVTGYYVQQNRNVANGLRQVLSNSCQVGNDFRTGTTQIWQAFYANQAQESKETSALLSQLISTLAHGDPQEIAQINAILAQSAKSSSNSQAQFLQKVEQVDKLRNCSAIDANAKSPSALPAVPALVVTVARG